MCVRHLRSRHLLNQNHHCAEAAEGLSADSPEDGSKPDFALRATVVGAGRSKGIVFACVESSEEMIILRIEWIIVHPATSVDKVIPHALWGSGVRTGNPKG